MVMLPWGSCWHSSHCRHVGSTRAANRSRSACMCRYEKVCEVLLLLPAAAGALWLPVPGVDLYLQPLQCGADGVG